MHSVTTYLTCDGFLTANTWSESKKSPEPHQIFVWRILTHRKTGCGKYYVNLRRHITLNNVTLIGLTFSTLYLLHQVSIPTSGFVHSSLIWSAWGIRRHSPKNVHLRRLNNRMCFPIGAEVSNVFVTTAPFALVVIRGCENGIVRELPGGCAGWIFHRVIEPRDIDETWSQIKITIGTMILWFVTSWHHSRHARHDHKDVCVVALSICKRQIPKSIGFVLDGVLERVPNFLPSAHFCNFISFHVRFHVLLCQTPTDLKMGSW